METIASRPAAQSEECLLEYLLPVCDRRQFLVAASATALTMKWHDALAACLPQEPSKTDAKIPHRIRSLRLQTAAPLEDMKRFYEETLGLPVERGHDKELTVHAGRSAVTFVSTDLPESTPWYHIAFNIPENKLFLAREWLLERTPLKIRSPGPSTHPDYPEVAKFDNWNAHSVFFWDPAGNLLEYIARHTLKNDAPGPFTPRDVRYADEIGLMADDIEATAAAVSAGVNLPDYVGVNDHFHPLGDHHGLVIVFPTGRSWRMPGGVTRPTKAYATEVVLAGDRPHEFTVADHPYAFRVESASEEESDECPPRYSPR